MSMRKVYIAIGIDHDNDVVEVLKVLELTVPAKHTVENPPVVKLDLTK